MLGEKSQIQQQRFQALIADELIHRAQLGDRIAHEQIYRTYSQAVITLANGFCRDRQAAEDILHNTFIKVISKVSTYKFKAPFGMWLRQIAVNESLNFIRLQSKNKWSSIDEFKIFDQDENTYAAFAVEKEEDISTVFCDQNELEFLLKELPDHIRLILWLKEVEGYTHDEIADLLGKSPSYSKSIISRCYKFLREKL